MLQGHLFTASQDYRAQELLQCKDGYLSIVLKDVFTTQNNTHLPISTVKRVLLAVIVPPVHAGHQKIPS